MIVVRALGLITVQDGGRPGYLHAGLARGGALVRGALVAANRALGNTDLAPGIEVLGQLEIRAEAAITIAIDHEVHELAAGDTRVIASEPARVAYLAIAGGVAAPIVLGSASTQLSAGIGAALRAGDRIVAGAGVLGPRSSAPASHRGAIRIVPGPDLAAFAPDAVAALVSAPYRISPTSDRVGTRMTGPIVERNTAPERTRPMTCGALEVPRDGQPIVLGREHPTTGGYPIVAVILDDDLDRFFSIRPGGDVTFEVGHAATSPARS